MAELFANFAKGVTVGLYTLSGSSIYLSGHVEHIFPPLPDRWAGDFCRIVISDPAGVEYEICKCVQIKHAASTNPLTELIIIQRGMEGTTSRAWPAGSRVELRLTAGVLQDIWAAINSKANA